MNQSLFCGMAHRCAGGSVGRTSHTCLIGKKSSLDPDHHGTSGKSSENCPAVKSLPEDQRKHLRDPFRIHHHGGKPHDQISPGHHRHDHRCYKPDPVDTSKNDKSCGRRKHSAYDSRIYTVRIPRNIIFQGRRHIKGLQSVKSIGKTYDQKY